MDRNVNFTPSGKYVFYYDKEKMYKKIECEYNEFGHLENIFKFYYPTNTLMYEVTFKDNVKHGITKIYDNSGCLATELNYVDNVVKEVKLFYNKEGAPILYGVYSMNGASLNGSFIDYTKSQLVRRKGTYEHDRLANNLKVYFENTTLLMVNQDYSGTTLINKETYDKSGRLLLKIGYNGEKVKQNAEQWYYTNKIDNKKIDYTFINNTVEIIELR